MSGETLTWQLLTEREPRLAQLLKEAKAVSAHGDANFCANQVWYREFKPRLLRLVGWLARTDDAIIRGCEAYDIAYRTVYSVLPACRNCGCLRVGRNP